MPKYCIKISSRQAEKNSLRRSSIQLKLQQLINYDYTRPGFMAAKQGKTYQPGSQFGEARSSTGNVQNNCDRTFWDIRMI